MPFKKILRFPIFVYLVVTSHLVLASENSIEISVNDWEGDTQTTDWFEPTNWSAGEIDFFDLPNPDFPVEIGPRQQIVNGIPTNTYYIPQSEANLSGSFQTPKVSLFPFDGICQIRISGGGLLDSTGLIGRELLNDYVPTGPVQPATIIMAGGSLKGNFSFFPNSKLIVLQDFDDTQVTWDTFTGCIEVSGSANLTLHGNITPSNLSNLGNLTISGNLSINSGNFDNSPGTFTIADGGVLSLSKNVTITDASDTGSVVIETGGQIGGESRLPNMTLLGSSVFEVRRGASGNQQISGTLNNPEKIEFEDHFNFAQAGTLFFDGTVNLTGGGEVVMKTYSFLEELADGMEGDQLINVDNTIRGTGTVNIETINNHIIRAEGSLNIISHPFDNSSGVFEIGDVGILTLGTGFPLSEASNVGDVIIESGGFIGGQSRLPNMNLLGSSVFEVRRGTSGNQQISGTLNNPEKIEFVDHFNSAPAGILFFDGTVNLTGGGEVVMKTYSFLEELADGMEGDQLINVDNTIRGTGTVNIETINNHIIRAEGSLNIISHPFDNSSGVFEIGDVGILTLGTGFPLSEASNVGDVIIESGGFIGGQSRLPNMNLLGSSVFEVRRGTSGNQQISGTLNNPEKIEFVDHFNSAPAGILFFDGTVNLTGGGEVVMKTYSFLEELADGMEGDQLINVDNTIRGTGTVNIETINNHIIRAEGSLNIISHPFDNSSGVFEIGDVGILTLGTGFPLSEASNVGDVIIESGGFIGGQSRLPNMNLLGSSVFEVRRGTSGNQQISGTLNNPEKIEFVDHFNSAPAGILFFDGTVNLTGGGEVVMKTHSFLEELADGMEGDQLVNVDNTIRGTGTVNIETINNHIIRAEGSLNINSHPFDNSSGVFEIADGGVLTIGTGFTILEASDVGDISIEPSGYIGGHSRLPNLNLLGSSIFEVRRGTNGNQQVSGTLTNPESIVFEDYYNFAPIGSLFFDGEVTLTGGGEIVMKTLSSLEELAEGAADDKLINLNNTIRGQGAINIETVNEHVIKAEGSLTLNSRSFDNTNGVFEIADGGVLTIGTDFTILEASDVEDISIEPGGYIGGHSRLPNLNLLGSSIFEVRRGTNGNQQVSGTLTNPESIVFEDYYNFAPIGSLFFDGEVTLTGGGEIVMKTLSSLEELAEGAADDKLINLNNTIRGQGAINIETVNEHVIKAEGSLTLNSRSFDNTNGVFEIADGGVLTIGTDFTILEASDVEDISIEPGGYIGGHSRLPNLNLLGSSIFEVRRGTNGNQQVSGTLTNPESIVFEDYYNFAPIGSLFFDGEVTLTGGGEIVMKTLSSLEELAEGAADDKLINLNNTIRGQGTINIETVNHGTIAPESGNSMTFTQQLAMGLASTYEIRFNRSSGNVQSSMLVATDLISAGSINIFLTDFFDISELSGSFKFVDADSLTGDWLALIGTRINTADELGSFEIIQQSPGELSLTNFEPRELVAGETEGYLRWSANLRDQFSPNELNPFGDYNGDGVVNLIEYVSENATKTNILHVLSTSEAHLKVSLTFRQDHQLNYNIQLSNTLTNWDTYQLTYSQDSWSINSSFLTILEQTQIDTDIWSIILEIPKTNHLFFSRFLLDTNNTFSSIVH